MRKWVSTIGVGLLLALWCVAGAQAATVTVDWGQTYTYSTAHLVPAAGGGRTWSEDVAQFALAFDDGVSTFGFCVAPTIPIEKGSYTYSFLDWTPDYLQTAWLMDAYAPDASTIDTRGETIGLQSAIWAAVTNNEGYKPGNNDAGQKNYYKAWYGSLPDSLDDDVVKTLQSEYKVLQAHSSRGGLKQTLIVRYPSPVPIPAAAWMLGTALAGLWGMRWRQRA